MNQLRFRDDVLFPDVLYVRHVIGRQVLGSNVLYRLLHARLARLSSSDPIQTWANRAYTQPKSFGWCSNI
jgi:hypothetical protein